MLGNRALRAEWVDIYRAMARWLLNKTERPVLPIDWLDCTPGRDYLAIVARVKLDSRTARADCRCPWWTASSAATASSCPLVMNR
ncbi:MAG: hypothetical protein ACREYC_08935 [Gammaproteobacteria bacterium]